MKSIRRQFAIYFVSLASVCIGFILYQFGWRGILLIFLPLFLILFWNWDEERYQRYVKNCDRERVGNQ